MTAAKQEFETECKRTLEHLKQDLGKVRTGRASGSLVEGIKVDYYGSQMPLMQMGNINVPEPRLVTIQVYDAGAVEAVEKAIIQSGLGLTPNREGNLIRLNIPTLTEERRKELVKHCHEIGESMKVAIRNHRRAANDSIKESEKSKEISQDDAHREQEEVQKSTDKYIAEVDVAVKAKEKEILEV